MVECPVCGLEIEQGKNLVLNELIECADCGKELEVISLNPFNVQEAPREAEDWGE